MTDVGQAVAIAGAESFGKVVATVVRVTGDWTLAEDAAQDAMAVALERWPHDGIPDNPSGWIMTVARNRAIDQLRRYSRERDKLHEVAAREIAEQQIKELAEESQHSIADDQLRLIFTCCHPALALEARIALTLRIVAGVPTSRIAEAFLVSESSMTRRITRAKTRIISAGIPYQTPEGEALIERTPGVLAVLYLLFTQGYNPDGEPAFADEAVRLTHLLAQLIPDNSEVRGLLALFLLQHSRRLARRDATGMPLTLDQQDRDLWDRANIQEGLDLVRGGGQDGPYALQAAIAACHARAPSSGETDWGRIARLYDRLAEIDPSPVIGINRAVAHGMAYEPSAGLKIIDLLHRRDELDNYLPALAAEAELSAMAGNREHAVILFRKAAELSPSASQRGAFEARLQELGSTVEN